MVMPWTRSELVVLVEALHEGMHDGEWTWIRATSPKAAALSELLRSSAVYVDGPADPTFRSVNSVQRKGENLRTARTGYGGQPTRGGVLDRQVVAEYERDQDAILEEAATARAFLLSGSAAFLPSTEDDELAVSEGKAIMRSHLSRERARGLRARKIASVKGAGLPVGCDVCGFDYGKIYGGRGKDYIEVHHVRPLHDSGPVKTALTDLALLCANCHRMIHRNPWLTPDELKKSLGRS